MEQYQASLKYKRDWKNTLDYVVEEAVEKGMEKGMKQKGYALNEISELTGLSIENIKSL